jgi:hypothetical protein
LFAPYSRSFSAHSLFPQKAELCKGVWKNDFSKEKDQTNFHTFCAVRNHHFFRKH